MSQTAYEKAVWIRSAAELTMSLATGPSATIDGDSTAAGLLIECFRLSNTRTPRSKHSATSAIGNTPAALCGVRKSPTRQRFRE